MFMKKFFAIFVCLLAMASSYVSAQVTDTAKVDTVEVAALAPGHQIINGREYDENMFQVTTRPERRWNFWVCLASACVSIGILLSMRFDKDFPTPKQDIKVASIYWTLRVMTIVLIGLAIYNLVLLL